jgi:hypothetical protein
MDLDESFLNVSHRSAETALNALIIVYTIL